MNEISIRDKMLDVQAWLRSIPAEAGQKWCLVGDATRVSLQRCREGCEELCWAVQERWLALAIRQELQELYLHYNPATSAKRLVAFLLDDVSRHHVYLCLGVFGCGVVAGTWLARRYHARVVQAQLMRAVVATSFRGVEEVAVIDDMPVPRLTSPDEVLVQVRAAAVDPLDLMICGGYGRALRRHLNRYNQNMESELPLVLGRDCSGVVVAVGCDVTLYRGGDLVYLCMPPHAAGVLCEYVVARQAWLCPLPPQLAVDAAAALPLPAVRAWAALQKAGGEEGARGKRVLVCRATSGVGSVLTQILSSWGAHVTAATMDSDQARLTTLLGATDHVTGGEDALVGAGEGFDIIFRPYDGPASPLPTLPLPLRPGGRVITAHYPPLHTDRWGVVVGGARAVLDRVWVLFDQSSHTITSSLPPAGEVLRALRPLIEANKLVPVVACVVEPTQAGAVLAGAGAGVGRAVIRWRGGPDPRDVTVALSQDL